MEDAGLDTDPASAGFFFAYLRLYERIIFLTFGQKCGIL